MRLTERAIFPLARDERKLETFPPREAATKVMPKATVGGGFNTKIKKKVNAGNIKKLEINPGRNDFGFTKTTPKS